MSIDKLLRIKIWSKVLLIISVVLFLIGIGVIFGPALIHESDMNQDALEYSELSEETKTDTSVDSTLMVDESADESLPHVTLVPPLEISDIPAGNNTLQELLEQSNEDTVTNNHVETKPDQERRNDGDASEYTAARNEGWKRQYAYQVGEEKQYMTSAEAALNGYPMKSKEPRSANKLHPLVAQWRSVEQLIAWRKAWADVVNRYLQAAGSSIRIDHRSYKERGIDLIPMIHEGPAARRIEARGGVSRRCEQNRQIRAENARKRGANTAVQ